MCCCRTFPRPPSKPPRRLTPESAAKDAGQTGCGFYASGRDDNGAPHILVLVDLPVGPVHLVAREEVVARGIDDELEQGDPAVGGYVVIDARLRTANTPQVRPGILVPGVLVDRVIPDRLVREISGVVRLSERERVLGRCQDGCAVLVEQQELVI